MCQSWSYCVKIALRLLRMDTSRGETLIEMLDDF